jgi:hypothetical protein
MCMKVHYSVLDMPSKITDAVDFSVNQDNISTDCVFYVEEVCMECSFLYCT